MFTNALVILTPSPSLINIIIVITAAAEAQQKAVAAAECEHASLVATVKVFEKSFLRRFGRMPRFESEMSAEYVDAHKRRRELQAAYPGLKCAKHLAQ